MRIYMSYLVSDDRKIVDCTYFIKSVIKCNNINDIHNLSYDLWALLYCPSPNVQT